MAKDKPKSYFRFFGLLVIKEGYLACRNLLGILLHPFKTMTVLEREKDSLQILLIFGLPFYFWLGGIFGILMARLFTGAPLLRFGNIAMIGFFLVSFLAGVIFAYLFFWFYLWLRRKNV